MIIMLIVAVLIILILVSNPIFNKTKILNIRFAIRQGKYGLHIYLKDRFRNDLSDYLEILYKEIDTIEFKQQVSNALLKVIVESNDPSFYNILKEYSSITFENKYLYLCEIDEDYIKIGINSGAYFSSNYMITGKIANKILKAHSRIHNTKEIKKKLNSLQSYEDYLNKLELEKNQKLKSYKSIIENNFKNI